MSTHTPRSWELHGPYNDREWFYEVVADVAGTHHILARVLDFNSACLISAAPEMLEALERSRQEHLDMATLLEAWARESVDGSWSTHQVGANRQRADQCRKFAHDAELTIAKARGGE